MKFRFYLGITLIISILIPDSSSAAVCDIETLKAELQEDIEDNGMLDCLREIDPPTIVKETEAQKNKRLAAQWDTSCSFEASQDWLADLKKYYGIDHLVDAVGEPVQKNANNQADMCEIVRAMIKKNFPEINMMKVPMSVIEKIDCVGVPNRDKDGKRICAATYGSFFDKDGWNVFVKPSSIKIGKTPYFKEVSEKGGDQISKAEKILSKLKKSGDRAKSIINSKRKLPMLKDIITS